MEINEYFAELYSVSTVTSCSYVKHIYITELTLFKSHTQRIYYIHFILQFCTMYLLARESKLALHGTYNHIFIYHILVSCITEFLVHEKN